LIEFYEGGELELYDLSNDISEKQNIIEEYPKLAEELKDEMHQYITERGGRYPKKKSIR